MKMWRIFVVLKALRFQNYNFIQQKKKVIYWWLIEVQWVILMKMVPLCCFLIFYF